jgi:hypothetical protein
MDPLSDNKADAQASKPVMDIQTPSTPPDTLEDHKVSTETAPEANSPDPIATPEIPAKVGHGKPIGAIVMAVLIAVGIAGLATYAYVKTSNTAQPASTNQTTSDPSASTSDVDDASKEVDDSVNSVDEAQDFPDNDLTDEALGL